MFKKKYIYVYVQKMSYYEIKILKLCAEERRQKAALHKIETEMHFLIECPAHTTERNALFDCLSQKFPLFAKLDAPSKFIFLLSQDDIELTITVIKHIHKWTSSPRRINI